MSSPSDAEKGKKNDEFFWDALSYPSKDSLTSKSSVVLLGSNGSSPVPPAATASTCTNGQQGGGVPACGGGAEYKGSEILGSDSGVGGDARPRGAPENISSDTILKVLGGVLLKEADLEDLKDEGVLEDEEVRPFLEAAKREKDYEYSALPESTFSFLLTSSWRDVPFWSGLMVFTVKTGIYILFILNLYDRDDESNPLGVPAAVERPVLWTQGLAFFISVWTQDDLVEGLIRWTDGYRTEWKCFRKKPSNRDGREASTQNVAQDGRFTEFFRKTADVLGRAASCFANVVDRDECITKHFEGGTWFQWVGSIILAISNGLLGLSATFMLIVSSSTVLDVLLNFAAVEFVSGLDNTAFTSATNGFLGNRNKEHAEIVSKKHKYRKQGAPELTNEDTMSEEDKQRELTESERKDERKQALRNWFRVGAMAVIFLIVMGCWLGIIFRKQRNGDYATESILVQFDDSVHPALGAHSGFYTLKTRASEAKAAKRFVYYEDRNGTGFFGYCEEKSEWTFSVDSTDPCDSTSVLVRSEATQTFDITDLSSATWYTVLSTGQHIPTDGFYLSKGCEDNQDCGGKGSCIKEKGSDTPRNRCECDYGFSGPRCEYDESTICELIQIDERFSKDFGALGVVSTAFKRLKNLTIYSHPVFVNEKNSELIIYTGLRWALTKLEAESGLSSFEKLQETDDDLFDAATISSVYLVSEPVRHKSYESLLSAPIGIGWLFTNQGALADGTLLEPPQPVSLICSICNNSTNPCSFENKCVVHEGVPRCQCNNGARGPLCQVEPLGDGACDGYFNKPEFGYDGGDCCRKTCTNKRTGSSRCGLARAGNLSALNVGFLQCEDPSVVRACNASENEKCYFPNSVPVPSLSSTLAYPILSANGQILVIVEPEISLIRVFDQDGSEWLLRGNTIRGDPLGNLGIPSVAIASLPGFATSSRTAKMPIYIAAVEQDRDTRRVRVYAWGNSATNWEELPPIQPPDPVTRLEIGVSYGVSVVKITVLVVMPQRAMIYSTYLGYETEDWETVADSNHTRYTTLSADGGLLAVFYDTNFTFLDLEDNESYPNLTAVDIDSSPYNVTALKIENRKQSFNSDSGLTIVAQTSVGDLVSVSRYSFNPEVGAHWQLQGQTKISLSKLQSAVFSEDSKTVVLVDNRDDNFFGYRTVVFDPLQSNWTSVTHFSSTKPKFLYDTYPIPVSVSDGGKVFADASSGEAETFELPTLCREDEVTVRLSLAFDKHPESVEWNAFLFQPYESLLPCNGKECITGNLGMRWSIGQQEFCVPKDRLACLGFTMGRTKTQQTADSPDLVDPIVGFAAYIFDGDDTRLFTSVEKYVDGIFRGPADVFGECKGGNEIEPTTSPTASPFGCAVFNLTWNDAAVLETNDTDTPKPKWLLFYGITTESGEMHPDDGSARIDCVPSSTCLNLEVFSTTNTTATFTARLDNEVVAEYSDEGSWFGSKEFTIGCGSVQDTTAPTVIPVFTSAPTELISEPTPEPTTAPVASETSGPTTPSAPPSVPTIAPTPTAPTTSAPTAPPTDLPTSRPTVPTPMPTTTVRATQPPTSVPTKSPTKPSACVNFVLTWYDAVSYNTFLIPGAPPPTWKLTFANGISTGGEMHPEDGSAIVQCIPEPNEECVVLRIKTLSNKQTRASFKAKVISERYSRTIASFQAYGALWRGTKQYRSVGCG